MKGCSSWIGVAGGLAGVLLAGTVFSQDITKCENGYLTFTNENPALYYRIEFKPNLTGSAEWDGAYRGLRNIQSSDPEVTVPVGVFYRVVGQIHPYVAGTASEADILSGKTAYVDDEEVTGTMANVGSTNITPGTAAQMIMQGYHDGTGTVVGDADLVEANIKKDVTIFGVAGTHEGGGGATYNAAVPKTGQTNTWHTGDDGDLEKGVVGPNPRFTDNANGTVTDNLTGLVWLKNANVPNAARTWATALSDVDQLNTDGTMNGNSADDSSNGGSHQTDWRLPNVRELHSLIDYGHSNSSPAVPSGHPFTGVQLTYYWSSSTTQNNSGNAWSVSLGWGDVPSGTKAGLRYVLPVRGGQ